MSYEIKKLSSFPEGSVVINPFNNNKKLIVGPKSKYPTFSENSRYTILLSKDYGLWDVEKDNYDKDVAAKYPEHKKGTRIYSDQVVEVVSTPKNTNVFKLGDKVLIPIKETTKELVEYAKNKPADSYIEGVFIGKRGALNAFAFDNSKNKQWKFGAWVTKFDYDYQDHNYDYAWEMQDSISLNVIGNEIDDKKNG